MVYTLEKFVRFVIYLQVKFCDFLIIDIPNVCYKFKYNQIIYVKVINTQVDWGLRNKIFEDCQGFQRFATIY